MYFLVLVDHNRNGEFAPRLAKSLNAENDWRGSLISMFPGVLALLERSLRIDARTVSPHVVRGALIVAIYGGIVLALIATMLDRGASAPGLQFFSNITYLNLVAMTLIGSSYFSTVITEEKEEDTLGLMLMAGITTLGILLGKTGSRLAQA